MTDQRPANPVAEYTVEYDSRNDKPGCGTQILVIVLGSGLLALLAAILPRLS